MAEQVGEVRPTLEEAELIDCVLDLVIEACADQEIVTRLKEKYRRDTVSKLTNQLRRKCRVTIDCSDT